MKQRTSDQLFLDQQAGTHFHFATYTKRINSLIPHGITRARAHKLPVIILRTAVDRLDRLSLVGESEEIETPVGIDVCNVKEGVAKVNFFKRTHPNADRERTVLIA